MAAIDFPSSPTTGQTFTSGGTTWIWDGVKWTSTSAATGLYLPLTGGTMTGDLILNRDAVAPLQAATFEQVQARGAGDNRIINGDMRIDQRNNGASGTANGVYTVDRWFYGASQAAKGIWVRNPNSLAGFPYCLQFVSSSAYALLAADFFQFNQRIEADMISDFAWGTAGAQPVTLSFWVASNQTGTFSGSISSVAATRSYPFTFSIPAPATWTKIVITIPGDTSGAWAMSGNAEGARINFDLGCGSTNRGPANVWSSAAYVGVTGSVSIVSTNAATFNLTGVKLEIGSIATPFNHKSPQESMADCQRYYQRFSTNGVNTQCLGSGYCANTSLAGIYVAFKKSMRASPTVSASAAAGFTVNGSATNAVNPVSIGPDAMQVNLTAAASSLVSGAGATAAIVVGHWIGMDAEL